MPLSDEDKFTYSSDSKRNHMLKDKWDVYLILFFFPTTYTIAGNSFFPVHNLFFFFFFLFICPDSELTAGFTYENQLTDVLQDIKHIYDKTPDKSLYIPNLSCKAGQGGG